MFHSYYTHTHTHIHAVCMFRFEIYIRRRGNKTIKRRETIDEVVCEKSKVQIRTRKRREKISSFFKFWRPSFVSIYYFFLFRFLKRRFFFRTYSFLSFAQVLAICSLALARFYVRMSNLYSALNYRTFIVYSMLKAQFHLCIFMNFLLICYTGCAYNTV